MRISLTALRLFCYSQFVITQDHGFGYPREPHRVAELAFCLVALTRATLVICSVLLLFCSVNCDYAEC